MDRQSTTVFYVDDNPKARELLGGVLRDSEPRVPVVLISGRVSYPPVEWCLADAHFGRLVSRRSAAAWSDST